MTPDPTRMMELQNEGILTDRDAAFLGPNKVNLFLATLASDPLDEYPSSITFLLEISKGKWEPDAPHRPHHGTLDPKAWNAAIMWIVEWCEKNEDNPWLILTSSILRDTHERVMVDPRASETTRSRVLIAVATAGVA